MDSTSLLIAHASQMEGPPAAAQTAKDTEEKDETKVAKDLQDGNGDKRCNRSEWNQLLSRTC